MENLYFLGNTHGQVQPYTQESTAKVSMLIGKMSKRLENKVGKLQEK